MDKIELEKRTKAFALRIMNFVERLPKSKVSDTLGRQLLGSGTSVGANYREANRAQSRSDFIHKIALVEKEAAETTVLARTLRRDRIGESPRTGMAATGSQRFACHLHQHW